MAEKKKRKMGSTSGCCTAPVVFIWAAICFLTFLELTSIGWHSTAYAAADSRVGTATATFLELGYGGAGNAMGDAYVSICNDLSAVYWNPAGLGAMESNEIMIMYQPWILDINTSSISAGFAHPVVGTFAATFYQTAFGEEKVTSMAMQDGTGEVFDGQDLAFSISYGRKLAQWFSFGATAKYISSRIWHETASAVAVDLGAIVNTRFFSWTERPGDGLNIGMSICNYGTRMRYNGIDLKETVDIDPFKEGNYAYIPARYETESWELPLTARIGVSINPFVSEKHRITLATDFLHLNNNSEYINIGAQYLMKITGFGEFALRGGYKGMEMIDSEYGLSLGMGIKLLYLNNKALKIDYAFRDIGVLGGMHTYSLSFLF